MAGLILRGRPATAVREALKRATLTKAQLKELMAREQADHEQIHGGRSFVLRCLHEKFDEL